MRGFGTLALLMFLPAIEVTRSWATSGMRLGTALAVAVVALLRRWSAAPRWGATHRLAAAAGLLLISPLVALTQAYLHGYGSRDDHVGLVVIELLVVAFLAGLMRSVRHHG